MVVVLGMVSFVLSLIHVASYMAREADFYCNETKNFVP